MNSQTVSRPLVTSQQEECETCQWFGGTTMAVSGAYLIWKRNTATWKGGRPLSWVFGLGLIGTSLTD
jgi:hypothetical protein